MTLQDQLNAMRRGDVAVPLTEGQALAQAMRLRRRGMTYGAITTVMAVYHGMYQTESWWRLNLRLRGAPPKHHANGAARIAPQGHRSQS